MKTILLPRQNLVSFHGAEATSRAPFGLLRQPKWDGLFIALTGLHATILTFQPPWWVIGLLFLWNANTISHNFIHQPFFRRRGENAVFSFLLTAVLGVPQELWKQRHLAHHQERRARVRWNVQLSAETSLVIVLVGTLLIVNSEFFWWRYLPGVLFGLALCQVHGHFEHADGTTSHYGRLYNLLFFNDGYHVEHHAHPARRWFDLPQPASVRSTMGSRWPATLRWLEPINLCLLERVVLRFKPLQQFVLGCHEKALRELAPLIGVPRKIVIIGGGLYPRTALVVRKLWPAAELFIIESHTDHIRQAQDFVSGNLFFQQLRYVPGETPLPDADLLIVPLAFAGDKQLIYQSPPLRKVLVHDWIWSRRGRSAVISAFLLKRFNLVGS